MRAPLLVASVGLLFTAIVALVAFVAAAMAIERWWPSRMPDRSPTEAGPPIPCAICQRPIPPGRGLYRTEQGDVHEECYQEQCRKPKPSP